MASIGPEAARDWIRLFSNEDGYPALNAVGDESFNIELDFREDQRLLFEGIIGRFTGFDGNVLVTLELRNQIDEALSTSTLSLEELRHLSAGYSRCDSILCRRFTQWT